MPSGRGTRESPRLAPKTRSPGRVEALRLGHVLDEYDLRWYEEPVVPEDSEGYIELRRKLRSPIAGGENEHTLYGFGDLLSRRAVDIAQPDIGSCGGVSALRHIAALGQAHGVEMNPRVWGSAVAQAASLHLTTLSAPAVKSR